LLNKNKLISTLKKEKQKLLKSYKLNSIGVFGSYIRDEQKEDSDVDILVEFSQQPDIFTYFQLEEDLENSLKVKVDLVNKGSIKPSLKAYILDEVTLI
jgi:uncharacterized protein